VLHARQHEGGAPLNTFCLELHDSTALQRFDDVYSFVGTDASGSFGLQAGHARFMTVLSFGLARFRSAAGAWTYLAMPGAALYFESDRLWLGTRRYLLDDDYGRISTLLREQLRREEQETEQTRASLRRMEEELLRKLWQMGQEGK
jgi:F-type H+-transporting ATPase subunit epsilon